MPDGTDRGHKMIITPARKMHIMFIVEDVIYHQERNVGAVACKGISGVFSNIVQELQSADSVCILCAFCNTMCVCLCVKGWQYPHNHM